MKNIHPAVKKLLTEIEAYRARSGLTRTEFGLRAVHNGNVISRLEQGVVPSIRTIDRIRNYIDKHTKAVTK
jgi:predicted transcriptional regulator